MKPSTPKPLNSDATLLCRISSEKQADGYSLDFQERGGRTYSALRHLNITKVTSVTESAFKNDRKEFEVYLGNAKHGPETHILIPKVDRSLRNPHDLAVVIDFPKLYPHKVLHFFDDGIIYQKGSPASVVLQLMMLGSMAVWYSHDLAQKSKRGMEEKARQGEWPNRAPYGYLNDKATKRIVVDNVMAPWIVRIKQLSAMGRFSCETIAQMIWKEGCPKRITKSAVHYIIRNPLYYGWVAYQDIYTKGVHEPLITKELHDAALAGLERYARPQQNSHDFLFKGMIHCARCGCAVVFERKKGVNVYGHCTRRRAPCKDEISTTKVTNVKEKEVEQEMERLLASLSPGPELSARILAYLEATAPNAAKENITQLAIAQQNVGRIKTAKEKARDTMCRNVISEADYTKQARAYDEQLVGLEEQIKKLEELAPASIIPLARATLELANCCCAQYKLMNYAEKRQLLDSVCSNFLLDGENLIPQWRKPFELVAQMALCPNLLHEPDALQNGKGLLFEFPFGSINAAKGGKHLIPQEAIDQAARLTPFTIRARFGKDRLRLALHYDQLLRETPALTRKRLAGHMGITSARLNQILGLLKGGRGR